MKAAEPLDGLVKLEQIVRPIAWQPTETDAELASTICGVYSVFVCLDDERGEWWEAYSGSGYLSAWSTCDEAKSAAEADYRARIASALNLDAVLSEIKRMREALAAMLGVVDCSKRNAPAAIDQARSILAKVGRPGVNHGVGACPDDEAAKLVDEMVEREAPGRAKLMLAIASRAIRRGRHLTSEEQLDNVLRFAAGEE